MGNNYENSSKEILKNSFNMSFSINVHVNDDVYVTGMVWCTFINNDHDYNRDNNTKHIF